MALSLQEERRQYGDAKNSNFVEIFKGTNLVCSIRTCMQRLISSDDSLSQPLSHSLLSFLVIRYVTVTAMEFQLTDVDGQRLYLLLLPAGWHVQSFLGKYDRLVSSLNSFTDTTLTPRIIGLVGILGAFFTSDQFGRRPIALAAACTLSASLLAIGIMSQLPSTTARSTALISFMCLWAFGFNSGVSPVGTSSTHLIWLPAESQVPLTRVKRRLHVFVPRPTVCRTFPFIASYANADFVGKLPPNPFHWYSIIPSHSCWPSGTSKLLSYSLEHVP
jgi:hypothetical protein